MVREYQSKLTTTEKQYEDHMTNMKHTHNREKEELRETLTAELREVSAVDILKTNIFIANTLVGTGRSLGFKV